MYPGDSLRPPGGSEQLPHHLVVHRPRSRGQFEPQDAAGLLRERHLLPTLPRSIQGPRRCILHRTGELLEQQLALNGLDGDSLRSHTDPRRQFRAEQRMLQARSD